MKIPYKKIINTLVYSLLILAIGVFVCGFFLHQKDYFDWRLDFALKKVDKSHYESYSPNIYFEYPTVYEVDKDENKRYGQNYIVGLKLKTDERTGCDIRYGDPNVDLTKSVNELTSQIIDPIKQSTTDFKLIENKMIEIGGNPALKFSFSFLDPIGARVRLIQIHIQGERAYTLICGVGEHQYPYFKKDFDLFFNSLKFDHQLINN